MGNKNRLSIYLALIAVLILASLSSVRLIHAQGTQPANAIELVGTITAMDTTAKTITINSLKIDISKAEIPATVKLSVGMAVKVEGTLLADGSISARQINLPNKGIQPGEVEIVGIVESLNATQIVVNGQQIDISRAEIGKGVAVGVTVKIHATAGQAGAWVAREVSLFTQPAGTKPGVVATEDATATAPNPNEFELTGTLDQLGTDFIVVSGQKIGTAGAEIKGQLVVGALVKVHVARTANGLVAREVELAQNVDNDVNDDKNATPSGTKTSDDKGGKSGKGDGSNSGGSNSGSGSGNGGSGGGHDDGSGHDAGDDKGGGKSN